MSNLTRFELNGLELLIDENTGEVFATQSAIARMVNKSPSEGGLRNFLAKYSKTSSEIYTEKGLRSCQLYSEDVIYEVFVKYNPELLAQCAKAGLRIYLHGLAGYKYEVIKPQVNQPTKQLPNSIEYVKAAKDLEMINNLSLQEILRDYMIDELTIVHTNKIMNHTSEPVKQYTIGRVRAVELGYTNKEIGNGSALGKYLKKNVEPAFEERVGKYNVNHYEVNDSLDTQIHAFFGMKKSLS